MAGTRTPHLPPRSGWTALTLTVAARSVLAVLISLLGWSLAPALFGWHPTVVMTGSMQPRLVPGDIVIARPIAAAQLALGQVLLVDSPDQPGELRLHRLVRFGTDGTLILRGDANRSADSSPVAGSAVRGVGVLHIPYLGRPYLWLAMRATAPLALTALGLTAVLVLAFWWRPAPAGDGHDDVTPPGARAEESPAPDGSAASVGRGLVDRALLVGLAAALLIAVGAGGADATTAYTGTTATPSSSWAAGTWFSCANAMKGDGAASALPLSESTGTTAVDISGNGANGTYSAGGVTYGVTGPCTHDNRKAVTLDGTAGKILGGGSPGNTAMTFEIWFKTSSSHGGVLMSLLNNGGQAKVALAMTSSGTLTFANGSASAAVTTTAGYNDGAWHLAVATVGTAGMALYVDTQAAVTSNASTGVAGNNATVHIGYGKASTLSTGSNDYFQGSIAFASWYAKALTSAQVAAHYAAAG
ncbi:MAG TPA: LamG-like jellyroll fold domain-containing protein [Jatrophihabitans sp.]